MSAVATGALSVVATISLPASPAPNENIVVNSQTNLVYVGIDNGLFTPQGVDIIYGGTNTFVSQHVWLSGSGGIDVDPVRDLLYQASQESHSVGVFVPTDSGFFNIGVAGCPSSVAVNPNTDTIYSNSQCCPYGCDAVAVIAGSTDTVSGYIPTGGVAGAVYVAPRNNMIYAQASNNVVVINGATNTVVATLTSFGIAGVNAALDQVYLETIYGPPTIEVFDGSTHTLEGSVSIPACCVYEAAANPNTNTLFLPITSLDEVLVVNLSTFGVVETVPVQSYPTGVAVDTVTNLAYVLNRASDSVSVISGPPLTCTTRCAPVSFVMSFPVSSGNSGLVYVWGYGSHRAGPRYHSGDTVVETVSVWPQSSYTYTYQLVNSKHSLLCSGSGTLNVGSTALTVYLSCGF